MRRAVRCAQEDPRKWFCWWPLPPEHGPYQRPVRNSLMTFFFCFLFLHPAIASFRSQELNSLFGKEGKAGFLDAKPSFASPNSIDRHTHHTMVVAATLGWESTKHMHIFTYYGRFCLHTLWVGFPFMLNLGQMAVRRVGGRANERVFALSPCLCTYVLILHKEMIMSAVCCTRTVTYISIHPKKLI